MFFLGTLGFIAVASCNAKHATPSDPIGVNSHRTTFKSAAVEGNGDVWHTMLYNAGRDIFYHEANVYDYMWEDETGANVKSSTEIYTSLANYYTGQASDKGTSFMHGMFSGSASMSDDRKSLTQHTTSVYVGKSSATYQYRKATVDPQFILSNNWELSDAMVALTPMSSDYEFFAIFEQFGTHYVRELALGGTLQSLYEVTATNYDDSSTTKNTISLAAEYKFSKLIGNLTAIPQVSQDELDKFDAATESSQWKVHVDGGDPLLVSDAESWKYTVRGSPSIIDVKLSVLSDCVYVLPGYEAKMELTAAMQAAMVRYFATCPSGTASEVCSSNGLCDFTQGVCLCEPGASGTACENLACPIDPVSRQNCGPGGSCISSMGECNCASGWNLDLGTGTCTHDCRDKSVGRATVLDSTVVGYNGHCLDWCNTSGGHGCGQTAADEFCRVNGYVQGAVSYGKKDGSSVATGGHYCPTQSVGDGSTHHDWACGFLWLSHCYPDTFSWITCKHNLDC